MRTSHPDLYEVFLLLALHASVLLGHTLHLLLVDVEAEGEAEDALLVGSKLGRHVSLAGGNF